MGKRFIAAAALCLINSFSLFRHAFAALMLYFCALWSPWVSAAPGDVDGLNANIVGGFVATSVVQPDGKTIIAGVFSSVLGQARSNIARLNADGTLDIGFNPGANNFIYSVVLQADGQILLGGGFSAVGGTTRNRIARVAANGVLDASFNPDANGVVLSIALQADEQIILAGEFTTIGVTTRNRVARLAANGTLDASFNPDANGRILSIAVQANGQILLGGAFNAVGGATRNRMARVAANGTLDASFNPDVNNEIYSVAVQTDGQILMGGIFTSVGGTTRNRIARVAANGTLDAGFNPDANNFVAGIAVQAGGQILLGGGFSTLGGTTRNSVARIAADGMLDASFNPNANGAVYSVALQADGLILLSGPLTGVGGSTRNFFARLLNDPATQTLSALDATQVLWIRGGSAPNVNQTTFELSTNGGVSYTALGGTATRVGSTANWQLIGLSLPLSGQLRVRGRTSGGFFNGSSGIVEQVASFTLPPTVTAISPSTGITTGGTNVTITGTGFTGATAFTIGGVAATGVSIVSATSITAITGARAAGAVSVDVTTPGGTNAANTFYTYRVPGPGDVDALNLNIVGGSFVLASAVQPDGKTIIAGNFSSVLGQARNNIARLNADGTLDAGFNPNPNNSVYSVAVQADGQILLGGTFTDVGGSTRNRIARVAANGTLDAGFNPNADSFVFSIAVQADGQILLGGGFGIVGGLTRNRIARVAANGTVDVGFNPNANNLVYSIVVQADGRVLLCGTFTSVGGSPRNNIARVAANGALDVGFNPNANNVVISIAVQADGQILLGGFFSTVGGSTSNYIARVAANGTLDAGFNPNANSGVNSIAVQADGQILIGGTFTTVGGSPRNNIARVAANGALDAAFNPNANGEVYSVAVQADGQILLGGPFGTVGGSTRRFFARLLNDPATQSLIAADATQVLWTRGGSAPELSQTTFELSTNGGATYTPLGGTATRVGSTANWQLTGLSLPASGQLRARGRTTNGYFSGSAGIVEQVVSFSFSATSTTITSDLPDPSKPFANVPVRVAVRATPTVIGNPSGVVTISNGDTGAYARSCSVTFAGVANEVLQCNLNFPRAGNWSISASYNGDTNWLASSDTESHTVRAFEIVKTRPNPARTNQGVSVAVNLDLLPFNGTPQPTGTITVSDGVSNCLITLPARGCLWSSSTEGLKQLQAAYSGDGNFPALISTKVPLQVGPDRFPELLSLASIADGQGNASSSANDRSISADGRFVAFSSSANNLVSGDTNDSNDIFVHDRQSGATTRVSVDSTGLVQGNNSSDNPSISADGRFVAFRSFASNLVSGDTNAQSDIFVHDRQNGATTRVNVDSTGLVQGNNSSQISSISADGRFVAFSSFASNLVSGDTNAQSDVFVHDRQSGATTRVSVDSTGLVQGNDSSESPSISADGRFVAFTSQASNLVSGDTNALSDVFVHDRQNGATTRVSVDSTGQVQGNNFSGTSSISADGRIVAFSSRSSNLVSGDTNNRPDIFVHDRQNGATTRVSVDSTGLVQGDDSSETPSISDDGRFVAFSTSASNLVSGDTNAQTDIFVHDRQNGATTRVSVDSTGLVQGNGLSISPSISADGRFVAFSSSANNMVSGDTNDSNDIFVHDRQNGATTRVNVDSTGLVQGNDFSDFPTISADGRFVAFRSFASNLVSGDTNGQQDVFLHDRQSGATTRISVDSTGLLQSNNSSNSPSISADGRFVAFSSNASNLVSGDTNAQTDIFVHDRQSGATTRVSVDSTGLLQGNSSSFSPSISADGRFVAFGSNASNLVSGDTNNRPDIFVHDRQNGATTRVSVDSTGLMQGNGFSNSPSISDDGRFVAFSSDASNLVSDDTNAQSDNFVYDRQSGATTRVSVDSTGLVQGNDFSDSPSISADGRFVAFSSIASNLVSGDTNARDDIFVHDRQSGSTSRLSVNRAGVQGNGASLITQFAIASSVGLVAFASSASNLAAGDDTALSDVFVTQIPGFTSANSTTTLITADTPDPSVVNAAYNVAVSVTRIFVGADVTGTVNISDGQQSCVATLAGSGASATGNCDLSSASAGSKNLIATYSGDANHAASVSVSAVHNVTAATVSGFTVVGDSPDPSRLERVATFSWSLTPAPIAPIEPNRAVSPTGTVTVKEAADCASAPVTPQHQCIATLPTASCQIAFLSVGIKNTVLCYSGDAGFAPASSTESHEVIAATVPVSLAWVQSSRVGNSELAVQFATASNVGTVAFDVAAVGLGQRRSTSDAGAELYGASELLPSNGDSIRATRYQLRALLPAGSTQFYLRGFDADGSVESFGPFTAGTESGSDPERDSGPVNWTGARTAAANAVAQNRSALRTGSSARGVYLQVANAGVQQITALQLDAAGYTALNNTPVAELALTVASDGVTRSVPIRVSSSDALWNSGDSLQFIGTPSDTQHSGVAVYTLAQNSFAAARIADISGTVLGTVVSVLPQTRIRRERLLFSPTSPGSTPWSWTRLAATSTAVSSTVTLNLPNMQNTAGLLSLTLLGGVDHDGAALDHHVVVALNGQSLGDIRFDGVRSFATTLAIPAGILRAGDNTLSLQLPADTGLPSDVVSLESVQIEANEALSATSGRMDVRLSTLGGGNTDALFNSGFEDASAQSLLQLALSGLSPNADFYRVRGNEVRRISGAVLTGNSLRIGVEARNGDRLIASDAAAFTPNIASVPDTANVLSGSAQYLVISHPSFIDQLGSLITARTQAGLSTKVVSTEQVYAAYSGGEVSAEAIARYLRAAKTQLGSEYVLLVGGDTLDARGYQNSGSVSFVPTLYRQTSQLVRFAPSDSALADTDQNGVQDLAIGRMPVRNAVELTQIIEKTLSPNTSQHALLVGDSAEPGLSFSEINTGLAPLLTSLQIQRAERDQLSAAQVNQSIVEHVNTGGQWLQYFGHAGPSRWSFDNVLSVSQLSSGVLTNTQPVKVLQWACWTNYFVDPTHNTLGHAWLNQAHGASLVLGPATLTETAHDEALAQKLLPLINQGVPLGRTLMLAKAQLAPGLIDVQLGVGLLGDPAAQ